MDRQTLLMQVINTLGSQVDLASARAILNNLVQAGALEENAGRSILAAVGDKALAAVPRESRDTGEKYFNKHAQFPDDRRN